MRIRIKFSKNDFVKYIGHLDIMRTFQRCFNRADIKMVYSDGFNPHQKMNFALPLGVGITSTGEYLDAEIADGQDTKLIKEKLNLVLGMGLKVISVSELMPDAKKAMASVRFASYEIIFGESYNIDINEYLAADSILVTKTTKSRTQDVDLKDMILKAEYDASLLKILVKAGSESNIKPQLIAENILTYFGYEYSFENIRINRTDLYAEGLIPLSEFEAAK